MNYIYASLLLHSAGKPVNEQNLKTVVESLGEKPDESKIKALVAALEGVNIEDVISKAAMPTAVAAAPVVAEKKEEVSEEKQEKKAEEAAEGLGALFG